MLFSDRVDAGRHLAQRLRHLRGEDVVVLGLPRGGVPVAFEVARQLGAPLDVIVVRKLGVPFQPELGFGAIGEGGVRVRNEHVVSVASLTADQIAEVEAAERAELDRLVRAMRADRPPVPLAGRTVVVVDDGLATGSTARAACQVVKVLGARRIVLAVPVAPAATVAALRRDADEVICLQTPDPFFAIGEWYVDFAQIRDEEAAALLARAAATPPRADDTAAAGRRPAVDEEVIAQAGRIRLPGHLVIPPRAGGVVVFAHGSGSSRHSSRNRLVADALNQAGLGTLLVDLLTADEESHRAFVFNIQLLAGRLADITGWLRGRPDVGDLPIGYFGASTGAAAALWAAAIADDSIAAIVSRGGRPDLAGDLLASVRAPTLLIVGSRDETVCDLNRQAQQQLTCQNTLAVVPGATHLFEEPGALDTVAGLARDWFTRHFTAAHPAQPVPG
ncbi:MAG TPA: phosphoribosyltransferase family protein [Streptosporangiaceae bacterium]|nr:phosphoribosyltransferase family protein [Streptosporangiaceae bacterium]